MTSDLTSYLIFFLKKIITITKTINIMKIIINQNSKQNKDHMYIKDQK